ncbi:tRNA (N6-threonylcarbamoyladenosine(37)-N6)-methyltransferase TrmO [Methanoculleus sp. MH98A]|jgi:tRNA-Thr(GGU) m(6)t(6)A37 methyltransferase TsaA|uniref:tRNA (N6-threonylcarbamoyladenosine(37)-N6)-methyltransferase TrmO n=1 Tax=Methanoculleus sp. MH98A TaxID=1495314 RepID=UPI0004A0888F|nr:tRNA (N6-threonylcarbamoyladenosine(37)-N6)-methyltransferase TrmO [Methanoculleus sp. MH98A]KDE56121.1 methyltransferase [Methanoculleus sp. MH98A]MDN5339499.1 tRNA (adenine37-N6)-methyltransferase [Euryarchaeota archaeon]
MNGTEYTCRAIGVARTPFTDPAATPIQATFATARGTVEVYPEFRDGLAALAGFSHLILIYRFHRAAGEEIAERPLVDGTEPHGIFATRHFNRPNMLGISVVRLTGIDGATLAVEGIDLLDGTPILDIKPYIPAFDSLPDAASGWVTPQHVEQIKKQSASFRVD